MTRIDAPPEAAATSAEPTDDEPTSSPRGTDRRRAGHSRRLWIGGGTVAVAVVVVLAVTGTFTSVATGQSSPPSVPSTPSEAPAPSAPAAPPTAPPPAASATAPAGLVVTGQNMPNPFVLTDQGRDYIYTGGNGPDTLPHVPVRPVSKLADLYYPTDAMPTLPPGTSNWIWTVDVFRAGSGFAMWFTTQDLTRLNPAGEPNQCLWTATASSPFGPFTPSTGPAICQQWGSIDARTTVGPDGTRYLVWKSDLNADRATVIPTTIWEQQLAPDGVTLLGSAHQIATSTQPWEGGLAESPDLVDLGGSYFLFFSGNSSSGPGNGVGVMACAGLLGPCTDSRTTPLVASNFQGLGPGEESLYQQDGVTWLLYSPNASFGSYLYRPLAVARVALGPFGPYVAAFDGAVPGT